MESSIYSQKTNTEAITTLTHSIKVKSKFNQVLFECVAFPLISLNAYFLLLSYLGPSFPLLGYNANENPQVMTTGSSTSPTNVTCYFNINYTSLFHSFSLFLLLFLLLTLFLQYYGDINWLLSNS